MAGYRHLDHPADLRILAWGGSVQETFTQATLGMWAAVTDLSQTPRERRWRISAAGRNLEELLVAFLNEQIFSFDVEGHVLASVEALAVTEDGAGFVVDALVSGCDGAALRQPLEQHLKAATFHDLQVSPEEVVFTVDV